MYKAEDLANPHSFRGRSGNALGVTGSVVQSIVSLRKLLANHSLSLTVQNQISFFAEKDVRAFAQTIIIFKKRW